MTLLCGRVTPMVVLQVASIYALATAITLLVELSKSLRELRLRTYPEQLEVLWFSPVEIVLRQMEELEATRR